MNHDESRRDTADGEGAWPERPEGWRHDAPDPPDAFAVPWRWWDGLGLLVLSLLAQALVGGAYLAWGIDPLVGMNLFVAIGVSQGLMLIIGFLYLRARGGLSWHLLGPVRSRWKHVAVGIGIGLSGYLIVVTLAALAQTLAGPIEPPSQEVLQRSLEGGTAALLGLALAAFVAPVVEEFIYRSVLFQGLRQRVGLWPAMGISSILFGAMHLEVPPFYMVILAIFGFWLAGAFHRTGSLVVPIVGHATFNAVQLSVGLLVVNGGAAG